VPSTLAIALLAVPAIAALLSVYSTFRGLAAVARLPAEAEAPPERASWPKLSVIVPACNEVDTLEAATKAKLASDYPDLEVVLVDDRSTDGTSELVDRLAASDPRVRAVHVTELPSGWLGKLHALHTGVLAAKGEWLLFSDADVHIAPTFLRRLVADVERRGFDFVAIMPQLWSNGLALDVLLVALLRMLVVGGRFWKVSDPRSRVAVGSGVFNLARRSAYDRTPGFSWLRLEIGDDIAFGQMMKRAGARCQVYDGVGQVLLHFYRSVGEMTRGLEKNGYVVLGQLRPWRAVLMASVILYLEVAPVAALAFPSTRVLGAAIVATMVVAQVRAAIACKMSVVAALVPTIGPLLFLAMMVRSALVTHVRGGVTWRGTFYPLGELRRGMRFEIL
jgi:hypothetical protein